MTLKSKVIYELHLGDDDFEESSIKMKDSTVNTIRAAIRGTPEIIIVCGEYSFNDGKRIWEFSDLIDSICKHRFFGLPEIHH